MKNNYQQVSDIHGNFLDSVIKRLPDNSFIPSDPDNTDYQAYQKWLAEGNTPLPPDA